MERRQSEPPFWTADQLHLLDDAIRAATDGEPTVLLVEGEPGMGKTAFLDEVDARVEGFTVLSAEAVEAVSEPYFLLQQLGVRVRPAADGSVLPAFHAAQLLRDALDARSPGPVLLRLDDVQWADNESLDALGWLMRRAEGDQLLVTLGLRALPAADRLVWQRRLNRVPGVRTLPLTGLTLIDSAALAAAVRPGLGRDTLQRLWEHTAGNPLYLSTLLSEHDERALSGMRTLPAPAEFARSVAARLHRLPSSSLSMVQAMAVLGLGWLPLLDVAALARVPGPAQVVQELADTGLVDLSTSDAQAAVRFSHALVRSAVYQQTPLRDRQRLHRVAAEVVSHTSQSLEHRVAATDQYDDRLAGDIEAFAVDLSQRDSARLAAHFWRWSSAVSSDRQARHRRWLESLLASVNARELATVRDAGDELRASPDQPRAALVLAALATVENRYDDAVTVLTSVPDQLGTVDQLTSFRSLSLLAWGQVITGSDNQTIGATLDRLQALDVDDRPFRIFGLLASGQLQSRLTSPEAPLAQVQHILPGRSAEADIQQTDLLSWRGALRVHTGFLADGIADLRETQRRILQAGAADQINGGTHGFLGQAYWLNGQWDLARICFRLTADTSNGQLLPLVLSYLPLDASGSGDFDVADRQLADAEATFSRTRWLECVQALLIARVVRAHAGGRTSEQATVLTDLERRWPELQLDSGLVGATWLLHAVLATIWAGRAHDASALVARMSALQPQAPWVPAAVAWLSGLIADHRHQPAVALGHLRAADDALLHDLPLYRAHLLTDRARLEQATGSARERDVAYEGAAEIYAGLGATPYLERLARDRADAPSRPAWTPDFTGREQEILALLLRGLSYTQIAKELFITNSTVSYHLSNMYSKAGVRSRHQLTEIARQEPRMFGISLTPVLS